MASIIKIRKAATEVSLLDISGFSLLEAGWTEQNDREIVTERIRCKLIASSDDDAADQFNTLSQLFVDAKKYSLADPTQKVPVYIEIQFEDETNKRYALLGESYVKHGKSYWTQNIKNTSLFRDIELLITREHPWCSNKPGILPGRIQLDETDGPALDYDETDFDVDLLSTFGHKPTTMSGGIIGRPGKYGGGVQVAEVVENLVAQTVFGIADITKWATGGTNTIARSTTQKKFGTHSLLCTYQDSDLLAYYAITLTAVAHTLGIWVYVPTSYDSSTLDIRFSGFVNMVGTAIVAVDMDKRDQWQFVAVPNCTPDAGDLAGILLVFATAVPSAGNFIYIDGIDCYTKAYAVPHCDGDLGPGHSWSGAVHDSTSDRVDTTLAYSLALGLTDDFTLGFWWKCPYQPSDLAADQYILDWYGNDDNYVRMSYEASTDKLVLWIERHNIVVPSMGSNLSADTFYHIVAVLDGTTQYLYVDGVAVDSDPHVYTDDFAVALTTLYLGAIQDGSLDINGIIDDFFVLDRAMSAAEVLDYYNSGKAFAGDPNLKMYLPFDGPQQNVIANYRDDVPLTHIYRYDASVPSFSANLIASREFTVLPDPIGQNDLCYFGSTDNPFHHVALHLQAGGNITTATLSLEYWNGAWTALTIGTDYTVYPGETLKEMLEGTGLALINVHVAAQDWASTTINSVTAYWVRIKEGNATPVYATDPIHIGPAVYTARTNELRIPAASLHGDASPLALLRLHSPGGGIDTCSMGRISRIIWGIKSQGLDGFTSNLNAGNQDNPSGWAVTYGADTSSSVGNWSPGGYSAGCTFATTDALVVRITMTGTSRLEYWLGRYRVLLLCRQTGGSAGQTSVRLRTFTGGTAAEDPHIDSSTVALTGVAVGIEALDIGELNIPFTDYQDADDFSNTNLIFQIFASRVPASGATLRIWALILIPIDQASGTINDTVGTVPGSAFALLGNQAVDHDKGILRRGTRKVAISGINQQSSMSWDTGGSFIEINNLDVESRIYFLMLHYPTGGSWGTGPLIASPGCALIAELYLNHNYNLLRGND